MQSRSDGWPKDTTQNIFTTGEFVVNMVDRSLADQMVQCGLGYPSDVDELVEARPYFPLARLHADNYIEATDQFTLRPGRLGEVRVEEPAEGEGVGG